MDDLPPPLILDILSRLHDSADVARCRVSSKTINSLSHDLRSVHLCCSFDRYSKSRSPSTRSSITPFKTIFKRLITGLRVVESVSIGVEKPLREMLYLDVEDEEDDLHLTNEAFLIEWLNLVCDDLKSLSISDFWVQSSWRRSEVLSLISSQCSNLLELEIKNAWLAVDNLVPMTNLTSLTLEHIRLDDEDLGKLNVCFPGLKVLNLIGVGGLKNPTIQLMHLETCQWTLSNAVSSAAMFAPNLLRLKLVCASPQLLLLETPALSDLHLSLAGVGKFIGHEFSRLSNLHFESSYLYTILEKIPFGKTIKNLKLTSPVKECFGQSQDRFCLGLLLTFFPNVTSLTMTPSAWSLLEIHVSAWSLLETHVCPSDKWMKGLKDITAYLEIHDFDTTLSVIFSILENCSSLSDLKIFIHRDVVSQVASSFISKCMTHSSSRVRWKWGIWKEGTEDVWMPDGA